MTMKKKIFYEEYMQRNRPKPPDSIYSNTVNKILEKASPSLFLYVAAGGKGREEQKNLYEYEEQRLKYMCYKRKLKKEEWERLYRICRNERRNR